MIFSHFDIVNLILVLICLLFIALLSASEASMIAVNKFRIRNLIEKGDKKAKTVQKIIDQHDRFFGTVILGGNFFTVLATSSATAVALNLFGKDGVAIATIVMTILTVIFGEFTPKTIAVSYSEKVALSLSTLTEFLMLLMRPVVWGFAKFMNLIMKLFGLSKKPGIPFVTEEEIKAMISIGKEEGALEEEEKEMLHKVFEFGDTMVSEAMVPRTEIVSIPEGSTVADALELVSKEGYSRYPVIRDTVDNITGILYVKDILIKMAEEKLETDDPITNLIREAYYIPENKMVTELLDEMQKSKFQIAIVVDEYGGTAGLITLEDLIEEIVGGLQDEFEEMEAEKEVEIIDERTFIVSGSTGLDEVNELAGIDLKSEDFNTIGGFLFGLFGRLPKVGEQLRYHDLRFLVLEMEGRKIERVRITKL
ncbi:MAG: hemolysin family protein [Nitrospirota bacterium]